MTESIVTQQRDARDGECDASSFRNRRATSMAQAHGAHDDAHSRVVAEDVSLCRVRR